MKHLSGIAALTAVALVMKFGGENRIANLEPQNFDKNPSFNDVAFWVLIILAFVWLLWTGCSFVRQYLRRK
jgi:hypothetical protein